MLVATSSNEELGAMLGIARGVVEVPHGFSVIFIVTLDGLSSHWMDYRYNRYSRYRHSRREDVRYIFKDESIYSI